MVSSIIKKKIDRHRLSASEFKIEDMIILNKRNIKIIRFNKFLNHKNFDSFRIIKVFNNFVYELNLSFIINNIYFIFHSWLLHLNNNDSLSNQIISSFLSINIDEKSEIFDVLKIVNFKIDKRRLNPVIEKKECLMYKIKYNTIKNSL